MSQSRILPTQMRHESCFIQDHKFSWADRAKIALGYTAVIKVDFVTQHNPGKIMAKVGVTLTEEIIPSRTPAQECSTAPSTAPVVAAGL